MAKPTKFEGIKRKIHAMISELPADERTNARGEIAAMVMTDLFNDAIQPDLGVSSSEAESTLAATVLKGKSIMRCL